jgi:O-antigen/teichoic acid export membrane protein
MTIKELTLSLTPNFLRPYIDRIQASPLGYRLAKGAFWSLAGAVIARALGLASSIIVARLIGKVGFGELGIINSTVGMLGPLAGFQMGLTATKHVAELRDKDPIRAGRIIGLSSAVVFVTGTLAALALVVLAPWMATKTLAAPHLSGLLQISSLMILFGALSGVQAGALAGFEAFKTIAWVNLLGGFATFPLIVGGVYLGGLEGAVWGMVLSTVLNWALHQWALHREAKHANVPLSYSGCTKEWNVLWRFSFPSMLASMISGPIAWVSNVILVNQPNGYSEMGIFNAANQWRTPVIFLTSSLGMIALPVLSDLYGKEDRVSYNKVLRSNLFLNATIALIIALPIAIFSPLIMATYGKGFQEGSWVVVILSFSAVIMAASNILGQAIVSKGRMWLNLGIHSIWAVVMLLTALYIVPKYLAHGLATATVFAWIIYIFAQAFFVRKLVE